jgi:hypothetical protein
VAISPLTPAVTGTASSFSVDPALPAGLSLNTTTGVISGTPTAATPMANYAVHAQNSGGTGTATVSIVVDAPAPVTLGYSSSIYVLTANVATGITPNPVPNLGVAGSGYSWTVTPALPTGLSLDATTGVISGAATAAGSGSYTLTASAPGATGTAVLNISVVATPLLDLGHASQITFLKSNTTRLLSLDSANHWVLWDSAAGTSLARGDGKGTVDLAGSVMLDLAAAGLETRSLTDGQLLATIPGTFSWYALSQDGSYVATGTKTALTAWSTSSGQQLFARQGDYSGAAAFPTATAILVAQGPAGANLIETVAVPAGSSASGPAFQGTFQAWFGDGSHFLTSLSTTAWVYSSASVQEDVTHIANLQQLGGVSSYFWNIYNGTSDIYRIGSSTAPALSGGALFASGTTTVVSTGGGQVKIVDLSGVAPAVTPITSPVTGVFTATSPGNWFAGSYQGLLVDGSATPARYLTHGAVTAIAAGTSYFAVSTSDGNTSIFASNTNTLAGTLPFAAGLLAMSADGTVLAASNTPDNVTGFVNIYSLPAGTQTHQFPPPVPVNSLGLSASGALLTELFANPTPGGSGSATCYAEVQPVAGGAPIYCDATTTTQGLRLSPDGTLMATQNGGVFNWTFMYIFPGVNTSIYSNGQLTTTVDGLPLGWLDNGKLLVQHYDMVSKPVGANYLSSSVYDTQGHELSTPSLPQFTPTNSRNWMSLTSKADTVYSFGRNQIFSLTSGQSTWASGNASNGISGVTGTNVIFGSGAYVLAQPY